METLEHIPVCIHPALCTCEPVGACMEWFEFIYWLITEGPGRTADDRYNKAINRLYYMEKAAEAALV